MQPAGLRDGRHDTLENFNGITYADIYFRVNPDCSRADN